MGMEYIPTQKELYIKVIGKKKNKKEMEKNFGLMGHYMKENIKKRKDMDFLNGVMEINMKGRSIIIIYMVKVYIPGEIKGYIMEIGKIIKWMEKVFLLDPIIENIMVNLKMIKNGYGEYEWADGRKYKGFWKNGKQQGKGEFYDIETNTWRKCECEDGNIIKWHDELKKKNKNFICNLNFFSFEISFNL